MAPKHMTHRRHKAPAAPLANPFAADAPENPDACNCRYLPFAFPGLPHIGCVFTTSHAGNMSLGAEPEDTGRTLANRQALLARFGLERWVELKQVHKDGFLVNPASTPFDLSSEREADGAGSTEKNLALLIKTADCQPVLLTNRQGTAVAALHVGWRGNSINFPGVGVERFCRAFDLCPEDLLAVRGPSLGPAAAEFINFEQEWPPFYRTWYNASRRTMDLWRLTRHQLERAGILPENIFSLDLCTRSLPGLFYSYRLGHGGRQASLIWIKAE